MKEFFLIMPEIVLALALAFVVACEITYYGERIRLVTAVSLLGLGGAFFQTLISYQYGSAQIFGGALSVDGFSLFFKLLFILLSALTIGSVSHTKEIAPERRTEYCVLILASTLSMCLVSAASDLILAFLSLLFMNVISYFLAAYGRHSVSSTEAAVKYLTFGTVASALMLYAFSILFASTHTLNIYEMHKALVATPLPATAMLVVVILCLLSFCFQIGAFPMYLLVPDVLEGAPTPVSAFLSMGPRAAGFAMTTRFLLVLFSQAGTSPGQWRVLGHVDWTQILAVISGMTMLVGTLLAFRQEGAKRLVSYLVVAETGFLLLGLLVLDEIGIAALLYNLVVELFALMGIFYTLSFMIGVLKSDRLKDLKGMLKRAVLESTCLILFLLCLVGSPPLPGFIGKFALIGAAIRHQRFVLALISIFAMVLSTASVARLAYHLIGDFQLSKEKPLAGDFSRTMLLACLMAPTILVGLFANFVFQWAGQSLGFVLW